MSAKNNINSLLLDRGFKQVVPTEEMLFKLGMTIKRFNKIIGGKTELTLTEAAGFAEWLGVTIEELSPVPTSPLSLAGKFNLNG